MRVIVINGERKSLEVAEIDGQSDIVRLIGHDCVISDEIDDKDAVYFDEECFIRGSTGKFQIDKLAPISGIAVVAGVAVGGQPTGVTASPDLLKGRIKFL